MRSATLRPWLVSGRCFTLVFVLDMWRAGASLAEASAGSVWWARGCVACVRVGRHVCLRVGIEWQSHLAFGFDAAAGGCRALR